MPLRTHWFAAVALLALIPLGAPPVASGGAAVGASADVEAAAEAGAGAGEFVVAFDRGTAGNASLRRAVADAGGTILDVNPQLGVALVRSGGGGFLDEMRDRAGIRGAASNHAVGTASLGMPHLVAPGAPADAEATEADAEAGATGDAMARGPAAATSGAITVAGTSGRTAGWAAAAGGAPGGAAAGGAAAAAPSAEPLADRQWNLAMIGATADHAHRQVTGAGVDVGIIDTGIDPRHPDIARNYDAGRSRNFTRDRPELDGPCEVASCVDPPDSDARGHGTHVAGIVAAASNGVGIAGVAPDARLVSLRAGQDSGYFFLYETVDALTAAGDLGLDVVNMSFYTDPWLYNCTSRADYLSGEVTDEELAQQRLTRDLVTSALDYAHQRGVTLVAASGNEHTDLAAPQRIDPFLPGPGPPGRTRTVRKECINLPSEGPHVVSVGAVGPSGRKADYSNWGYPSVALVAPGGWNRDRLDPIARQPARNLILSAYPLDSAIGQGLADASGAPVDEYSVRSCDPSGAVCGFYTYLQGTSMAAPHVVGVAALLVQRHGAGSPQTGYSLAPDQVAALLVQTAKDHACPAGGVEDYAEAGRAPDWSARCAGGHQVNEVYGEGIVDATALGS